MLVITVAVGALWLSAILVPRVLVALTATIIAVFITRKAEQAMGRLLANPCRDLDYDYKPSGAERRLMRTSLRLAIAKTELRSLLPTVMANADAIEGRSGIHDF